MVFVDPSGHYWVENEEQDGPTERFVERFLKWNKPAQNPIHELTGSGGERPLSSDPAFMGASIAAWEMGFYGGDEDIHNIFDPFYPLPDNEVDREKLFMAIDWHMSLWGVLKQQLNY